MPRQLSRSRFSSFSLLLFLAVSLCPSDFPRVQLDQETSFGETLVKGLLVGGGKERCIPGPGGDGEVTRTLERPWLPVPVTAQGAGRPDDSVLCAPEDNGIDH